MIYRGPATTSWESPRLRQNSDYLFQNDR